MFQQDGRRSRVVERDNMKKLSKTILAKRDIKKNQLVDIVEHSQEICFRMK